MPMICSTTVYRNALPMEIIDMFASEYLDDPREVDETTISSEWESVRCDGCKRFSTSFHMRDGVSTYVLLARDGVSGLDVSIYREP